MPSAYALHRPHQQPKSFFSPVYAESKSCFAKDCFFDIHTPTRIVSSGPNLTFLCAKRKLSLWRAGTQISEEAFTRHFIISLNFLECLQNNVYWLAVSCKLLKVLLAFDFFKGELTEKKKKDIPNTTTVSNLKWVGLRAPWSGTKSTQGQETSNAYSCWVCN